VLGGSLRTLRKSAIEELTFKGGDKRVRAGDLCSMQNGRSFPGREYGDRGIRLLRPGNLDASGYLSWQPEKTVYLAEGWASEASEFRLQSGDVVINLTAQSLENGFLGRVCLVRDGDDSLLNQRIGRFTDWSSEVEPSFFFRSLQTARFQQHVVSMCEGTKVKHLFWPHIASFEMHLPSRDTQRQAADAIAAIDSSIRLSEDRLGSARTLHWAILAFLLSGQKTLAGVPAQ
jgi:type I restriction enzyme S subunit